MFQKVTKHVYKTCLKLDVWTFLDAYDLLAYGVTVSEQLGKPYFCSNKISRSKVANAAAAWLNTHKGAQRIGKGPPP